jgi:hypothetical protein
VPQQLDFSKNDAEIFAFTEKWCRESQGFEPRVEWRKHLGKRTVPFKPTSGA